MIQGGAAFATGVERTAMSPVIVPLIVGMSKPAICSSVIKNVD